MFKKGFLSNKPRFSIITLLLFALVFTAAGIYLIYLSLASDTFDIVDGSYTLPSGKEVLRVGGTDRYSTAVGVSQKIFPEGSASCVVVTYGGTWPDAATASSLAGACNGSILLAQNGSVTTETANEIKRLSPSKIYMVGGTSVLYPALETYLKSLVSGSTVKRIAGATRYDTAVLVAKEIASLKGGAIPDKTILVVTGINYPDALTVGSVASLKGYPIIYADTALPATASGFIRDYGITKTIIVGGTNAVSAETAAKLPGVVRITGADRYQTSYNFALYALRSIPGMTATNVGVASGANYPDALTSGPFLAKAQNSVLILDDYNTKGHVSKLIGSYRASINKVFIIGGSLAISDASYMTYANSLGSDFTYAQVKTQAIVDAYIRSCPILAGSTVDYGPAQGYKAVAYPRSARIEVSPTGIDADHPLSILIYHEIHHVYDERDGNTDNTVSYLGYPSWDWGEQIPPRTPSKVPCIAKTFNTLGYILRY